MKQFWGEALLITFLAMLLGIQLVQFFIPTFNALSGKTLTYAFWGHPVNLLALVSIWLLVSFLAGIYPSLLLSGFDPVKALKDKLVIGRKRSWGQVFVGAQFTATIALSICVLVISEQLSFMQARKLNHQEQQILVIQNREDAHRSRKQAYDLIKSKLATYDFVQVTGADGILGGRSFRGTYEKAGGDGVYNTEDDVWHHTFVVDYNYLDVYEHEVLEGRTFSADVAQDPRRSVLINEALVRALGLESAVGSTLKTPGSDHFYPDVEVDVIGVVKDFHFEALQKPIGPAAFALLAGRESVDPKYISVRFHPEDFDKVMALARQVWKDVYPDLPFDYSFYDEHFAAFYQSEKQWQQIVGYASAVGLLIACLGVFGLSMLAAINRTKEIGIRKVLGAQAPGILFLFSKEFIKPVALASVFAAPIAYSVMHWWLRTFAYKVDIGVDLFLGAAGGVLFLVFLTVSYHAVKTAGKNPVDALRYE